MPASNTEECFLEFIGQRVTGVLMGPELRRGNPNGEAEIEGCLVFEDGRALCWYTNGAFYVEGKNEVSLAIAHRRKELEKNAEALKHVVDMAGAVPNSAAKTKKGGKKGGKAAAKS